MGLSMAVEEFSLDIVLRRLKLILKFFLIGGLEEYVNLHNKTQKFTCAKYVGN
jgi:hypothetical protein